MRLWKWVGRALVGVSVAALWLAPAGVVRAGMEPMPLEELVRRAKAEGEVSLYTSSSREAADNVVKPFEQRYGIRVRLFRAGTTEIAQKVTEETRAGRVVADVVLSGAPALSDLEAMGVPFAPLSFSRELAAYPDYTKTATLAYVTAIGVFIMYNKNLVPPAEVPRAWEDLLHPRWRNRLALPDPAGSSTPQVWMQMMLDLYGEDYLRRLGQQRLRIYSVHGSAAEAVERGEVAAAVEMLSDRIWASQEAGAPVAASVPKPTFLLPRQIGIHARAPHPNAARLLFEFMMSQEGQQLFNVQSGQYSYRRGIEHPGLYPIDQIEQYMPDWKKVSANRQNLLALADRYFR